MAASPLEIRHASQRSQDSGAYLDWSSDSGSPTRKHSGDLGFNSSTTGPAEQEFITVVSVEDVNAQSPPVTLMQDEAETTAFVTVLAIGDENVTAVERTSELGSDEGSSGTLSTTDELHSCQISSAGSDEATSCRDEDGTMGEEVLVYRLPGERLGFGLKFEGGTKTQERVRRLFIQSCAPDSPASRARCSWGALGEGDELVEIDGTAVSDMTRLDCVRCLKESQVVIKLRVVHTERFIEIPLDEPDEDGTSRPLVVSELKKNPPSPPPIPPRKAPRKSPVVPPREPAPLGPPSGFDDPTPPVPRQRQQPPQPEVYLDLLAQEELAARSNCESESDDTGSSISTVVDRGLSSACSFSSERATTPIDMAKVLGPFEQLERELSSLQAEAESFSLSDDEEDDDSSALQPPESFQDNDKDQEPPKPAPRVTSPSKFRSGKKRPPPPPPPPRQIPRAPPEPAPRPPERLVSVKPDLTTPPSSPEVTSPPDTPTRSEPDILDDDAETAELALWVCTGLATIGEEEEAAMLGELLTPEVPEVLVVDSSSDQQVLIEEEEGEIPAIPLVAPPELPCNNTTTPEALLLDVDDIEICIPVPRSQDTRLVPIPEESAVALTDPDMTEGALPTAEQRDVVDCTVAVVAAATSSLPLASEMPAQACDQQQGATTEEEETAPPPTTHNKDEQTPWVAATTAPQISAVPETPATTIADPEPVAAPTQTHEEEIDGEQRVLSEPLIEIPTVTSEGGEEEEDTMNGLVSLPYSSKPHNGHHHVTEMHLINGDIMKQHVTNGDLIKHHVTNGDLIKQHDDFKPHVNGFHCNGSADLLSCDDVTPPPSFSRLPPDGHEFPPSYMEPSMAPQTVSKWRQDEKSQRSVRDKIALFSCSEEVGTPTVTSPTESPATLARFRSTEDIRLSGPASAHVVLERAVSTADLQCPTSTTPRFSTLPRKPATVTNNNTLAPSSSAGLGRALSFSHSRSQSLIDVTQPRPLSALLEQRRRGISKLRGLVIPERPELPVAAVDLPEIRSRELVSSSRPRPQSYEPIRTVSTCVAPQPPQQQSQMLPALPSLPKYSPAFKRKPFSLLEMKPLTLQTERTPDTNNKNFSNYFAKPDTLQLQSLEQPKSLESLQSSPRSESSSMGGEDELDSDSAVSSGRSSPPHESLSSESSCTLTSGSSSSSERRVLRAQSVEATNRKNILASARSSSGRGIGSPLIQRRYNEEEESDPHHQANSKPALVVHTLLQDAGHCEFAGQQPIKVAYLDELCEFEVVPEAPVDTPPPTPVSPPPAEAPPASPPPPAPVSVPPTVREPRSPPAIAPRSSPRSMLPQPLRVTEMRVKTSPPACAPPPPPPVTSPPPPPPSVTEEVCVITTRTIQVSGIPVVAPRTAAPAKDVTPRTAAPAKDMTPHTAIPVKDVNPRTAIPAKDITPRTAAPAKDITPRTAAPAKDVTPRTAANDVTDTPTNRDHSWQTKQTTTVSPRNSRQEQVQTFRDIADRWQSMADAPPPAPVQAVPAPSTPRTAPAKPGRRSASVNDIRRAFEKSPTAVTQSPLPTSHARVSSLDSSGSCSEDVLPTKGPLSCANSMEQLGSISSLASTTSLISQQELQGMLDEAAAEEGAQSGDFLVVVLHRDSAASSVGITLAGGADYESRDITVHKVLGGSPAERDGRVQKGDRILSINGRSMKGLTHREALLILKAPRPEVVLVVARGRTDPCEENISTPRTSLLSTSAPATTEEAPSVSVAVPNGAPILVSLCKDGAGLGFSLEGGKDSPLGDRPLTIKKVFTGGAAEKSGQLHAGDHLLAVNGTDVSCMSRIEAWGLMKRLAPGQVTLLVRPQQ